jgi:hypothetical protein
LQGRRRVADLLATSRQAFAVNPSLAWDAVSTFRKAWGFIDLSFPTRLLWARGAPDRRKTRSLHLADDVDRDAGDVVTRVGQDQDAEGSPGADADREVGGGGGS